MNHGGEPYELRIAGPAARALASRLPEKIAAAVHEFITTTLLENPHRLGKPLLLPPYQGTWSARRGTYRVLYEIDDESRTVLITAVEHRSDAYRSRRRTTTSDDSLRTLDGGVPRPGP